MSCLKLSNFPETLKKTEIEDFLKHFGATSVKCVGSRNPISFATFDSDKSTATALKRLHQLEVLGNKLVAVYSKRKPDDWTETEPLRDPQTSQSDSTSTESQRCYQKFLQSLNAWSLSMELSQPPPSHLLYLYPPPSLDVLANISRALVAVPKFYNQVLHLMNKMNLPSPFHTSSPEFRAAIASLFGQQVNQPAPSTIDSNGLAADHEEEAKSSSNESELESDSEPAAKIPEFIPLKRKLPGSITTAKRPKLLKSTTASAVSSKSVIPVTDVFEVSSKEPQKNITLNLSAKESHEKESERDDQLNKKQEQGGFGVLFPVVPEERDAQENVEEQDQDDSYISMSKLRSNRIPEKEQANLPVYRNYQPGAPSCRLYIKNLAKTTTARELHFIFRAFIGHKPTDEEDNKMFDILHMTEGRMKGQAFVTFPSVSQAQTALQEVNGYILNDKPMVIQFGRSKVQTVSEKPNK